MGAKERGLGLHASQGKRSGGMAVVAAREERQGRGWGPHVLLPFPPRRSLWELCSKTEKLCGGVEGERVVSLTDYGG